MPKIVIDTDGTFANTKITIDGNELTNIEWARFSMWKSENPEDSSVSMAVDVMVEDESGLLERKSLVLAGTKKDLERAENAKLFQEINDYVRKTRG